MYEQSHQIILTILIVTTLLIIVLGIFIVYTIFQYQRRYLDYQRNLQSMQLDFEKKILLTKLEIQENTFQHISQEIHDNITLTLSLAKLHLNTFLIHHEDEPDPLVSSSVDLIGNAILDLNDVSTSLDSRTIESNGLQKAVELEIERLKAPGTHNVKLVEMGTPIYMDTQRELLVFRILQESINNILKHSYANTIWIELSYNSTWLELLVRDNGVGFCEEELKEKDEYNNMSGLDNIRMRTSLLEGEVSIISEKGMGTRINVCIPYTPSKQGT